MAGGAVGVTWPAVSSSISLCLRVVYLGAFELEFENMPKRLFGIFSQGDLELFGRALDRPVLSEQVQGSCKSFHVELAFS